MNICDRIIKEIWIGPNQLIVSGPNKTPDNKLKFNFDITAGEKSWLVLDPYGNDWFPLKMSKRIFGTTPGACFLAIKKDDGKIYQASFHNDQNPAASPFQSAQALGGG